MGFIVRDFSGKVIAMTNVPMEFVQDSSMAKALAVCQAVEFNLALGMKNCIFEGDALEVIRAINQEERCMGVYGQIVNDVEILLMQGGNWVFNHVRRGAKRAAHLLAKVGLKLSEAQSWNSDLPDWMIDIVRTEQNC